MGIAVKSSNIITISDKIVTTKFLTNVEYGYLYNWHAVNNAHGLAPTGYHVPTNDEFTTLSTTLATDVGSKLKEAGTTHWTSPNYADNSSGFTALGIGFRHAANGTYVNLGSYMYLFSATLNGSSVYGRYLMNVNLDFAATNISKVQGSSIRMIRDSLTGWSSGEQVVDLDGNIYDTVRIGDQVWLKQNWASSKYNDGTSIPLITVNATWIADTTGARCAYNNDNSYVFL